MTQTQNLGLVQAIFVGPTAPSNTNVIWRDNVNNVHKSYDPLSSSWIALGGGGGGDPSLPGRVATLEGQVAVLQGKSHTQNTDIFLAFGTSDQVSATALRALVVGGPYLTANQTITLTGDIVGSGATSINTTLATVNANVGIFGSSVSIPSFTVNAKGLITAVSTSNVATDGSTIEISGGSLRVKPNGITNSQLSAGAAVTNIGYTPITNVLNSAQILVGSAGNIATAVSMTGDITITNGGVTAIGANKVLNSMIRQSSGLSILGRSANTTGDIADITGTVNQILRVSGTTLGFGSIDLSQAATVGSSILPIANGGTGVSTGAWLAATGVTLSGVNTITSNAANQLAFTGTWTATANNQYHVDFAGTFTMRSTTSDNLYGYRFRPTIIAAGLTQTAYPFSIDIPQVTGGTNPDVYPVNITYNSTQLFAFRNNTEFQIGVTNGAPYIATGTAAGASSAAGASFIIRNKGGWGNTDGNIGYLFHHRGSTTPNNISWHTFKPADANTLLVSTGTKEYKFFEFAPVWNASGGTHTLRILDYIPTETSIVGFTNKYGITIGGTDMWNGFNTRTPTATLHVVGTAKVEGILTFPVIGNGISIKEGTNARAGIATLVAGTVTVANTSITANTRVKLTPQNLGTITVPVGLAVSARIAGTSFTILSGNLTDTSIVYWELQEPAP